MEEMKNLVALARDGDAYAYGQLVQRLQAPALAKARHILRDYHLAEDAVQEAFVAAYTDLGKLRDPQAFTAWLLRIVAHRCHRLLRGQPPRSVALDQTIPSAGPGPQQGAEADQLRWRIETAIRRLPTPERRVLTLFYMDDLSHKDIAAVLGIPPSTANSRLYTSRERLRQELRPMGSTAFVHLYGLSEYSLGKGKSGVEDRVRRAAELGFEALALSDTDGLFGAVRHFDACRAAGIAAVLGCRLRVQAQSGRPFPVGLVVRDRIGYRNLVRLVSKAHLESPDGEPWIELADLRQSATGLFCLSGGIEGEVGHLLSDGQDERAAAVVRSYKDIFGQAYYLEIQRHGAATEDGANAALFALHNKLDVPLVATHAYRFLRRKDYTPGAGGALPAMYMKSPAEMNELFADLPVACDNSVRIAAQCQFDLRFETLQMPDFPLPVGFDQPDTYLRHLAFAGLQQRLSHAPPTYAARLETELEAVCRTGFSVYFLIVSDYTGWARRNGVRVGPGRGSSSSSLLNYCLHITDISPVAHRLAFSRFYNANRLSEAAPGARPDIDIDLMPGGRERVMDYIVGRYGEDCVSRVTAAGDFKLDRVLRQVGHALQVEEPLLQEVMGLLPAGCVDLEEAIKTSAALRRLLEADGPQARMLAQAQSVQGMAARAFAHWASLIVAPAELSRYVPLYRTAEGYVATQYDARACEEIALLKIDLLELSELGVLDRACRRAGVDPDQIPLDDKQTFAALGRGENQGLLQLAGPTARDNLRRMRPECFGHLVDLYTLHSPGPLQKLDSYIERRHGRQECDGPHPALAPFVDDTYGLLIYQEQLMQAVEELAGYNGDEADSVRRHLPRGTAGGGRLRSSKAEAIEEQQVKFVGGCVARGMDEAEAEAVWEVFRLESVTLFNRSHAVAYALIDYWLAFMAVHHAEAAV
jgi:DNA polymerase III subunit alpha